MSSVISMGTLIDVPAFFACYRIQFLPDHYNDQFLSSVCVVSNLDLGDSHPKTSVSGRPTSVRNEAVDFSLAFQCEVKGRRQGAQERCRDFFWSGRRGLGRCWKTERYREAEKHAREKYTRAMQPPLDGDSMGLAAYSLKRPKWPQYTTLGVIGHLRWQKHVHL